MTELEDVTTTSSTNGVDESVESQEDASPDVIASMPLPKDGAFHPEFLFCGECTSCNVHPPEEFSSSEIQHLGDILQNSSEHKGPVRTRIIVENLSCPSQVLVIQSLLQPLPGVSKVIVNLDDKLVFCDHDATCTPDRLVSTLKEMELLARLENEVVSRQ